MKHLAAMNIVGEASGSIDGYTPTPLSNSLTEEKYRNGIIYTYVYMRSQSLALLTILHLYWNRKHLLTVLLSYDVAGPSFRGLPEYLKGIQYDLPTMLIDGPFQAAHKTQLPFFAWLDAHPPYLQVFNSYMSAYRAGRPSWVDPGFYPVADQLSNRFDPAVSDVILVDVGGGLGHDLEELKAKHPSLPGRVVLQDRAEVIATVSADGPFEATAHDFFTLQPVKGARAYYLHSVLHDWSDDDCVKILEQLKPALRPGYSTLLINELVVPRQNPTWPITSMDQLMLVLGAMQERTEEYWEQILSRAGFKIVKMYGYEMGSESLIEAELA